MNIEHAASPCHPYPRYRPSSVEWLGDVPAHWEVRRAKYYYRESQEVSASGAEELMSVSHRTGVTPRKANVTMFLAESNVGYKICRPDDIVINTMWAYMAALGVARQVGIVSPSYGVYRPREPALMNPDYVDALLRTEDYRTEYTRRSTGITDSRLRLYPEQFLEIPMLCPPLAEQAAIVRYLDHADALINRYISAKERLVTLLEDQRQTAIHQAVTRGLDPNVRLKPSGVTWLGDVPAHWETPRLRYLGNAIIGLTYEPRDVTDAQNGTLVFRASNIQSGRITYEDSVYVRTEIPALLVTLPGDILICSRSGSRALVGKNAMIDSESAGNTFGAFMTVFRSSNNGFLHYVFNSRFFEYHSAIFSTSTVNQLTLTMINDMKVPFPPADEQAAIVEYLDHATAAIDAAIARARRQIELMQEYRTRLIADVVTGQVDARAAAGRRAD